MVHSPFGPTAVGSAGRYLRAWPASAALGAVQEGWLWTRSRMAPGVFADRTSTFTLHPSFLAVR
eukprot:2115421-Lingulodinium_polyedra.AAC.1